MRNEELGMRNYPSVTLMGEEGASLSSGSLRLYAIPNSSFLIPNSAVGCIDLYIMVATEYRRQGYALAMLHEFSHLSPRTFHLHCLYADIAATNSASIALFQKAGYTECGHFREWLCVDGRYVDTIRMQLLL